MATKEVSPSVVLEQIKHPPARREHLTLEEAFALTENPRSLDDEKAARAIALLLEWASEYGNDPMDPLFALCLSKIVYQLAERMAD